MALGPAERLVVVVALFYNVWMPAASIDLIEAVGSHSLPFGRKLVTKYEAGNHLCFESVRPETPLGGMRLASRRLACRTIRPMRRSPARAAGSAPHGGRSRRGFTARPMPPTPDKSLRG